MSIIRETKWALLELFPDQKAVEADAEKAAREKLIADARAQAEAQAEKARAEAEKQAGEEATPDKEGEKKSLSAVDQAAEDIAAINLMPEKQVEETAEAVEAESEEAAPEPEDGDPPVSLEPEDKRPNGVLVRDYAARGFHIDVLCAPDQVVNIAEMLNERGFTLEAVTGVDWIKEEEMEVVYDYSRTDGQLCRVAVRARLPRSAPEIPTISGVYPGANWHERETHEFFGIVFQGHPYLVPLLLPEDADFHPLLKDFTP